MRLAVAEMVAPSIIEAETNDALWEALARAAREMGFDHFALSLEVGRVAQSGTSVLVHDYPQGWADAYVGLNLAPADPIRRAAERSLLGFRWGKLANLIPMNEFDSAMLSTGARHGIGDGYTVPRHLLGEATGSCSFAVRPGELLPTTMLWVAELIGGLAIAGARRIAGAERKIERPVLSDRQRECVLWAARGKTDWEIARILGISYETVVQHLKAARERYDAPKRATLILHALFDGLISFADIFRWRNQS